MKETQKDVKEPDELDKLVMLTTAGRAVREVVQLYHAALAANISCPPITINLQL